MGSPLFSLDIAVSASLGRSPSKYAKDAASGVRGPSPWLGIKSKENASAF